MAKEYSRTQRVADYLQRELASLIQQSLRDPRLGMISVTGVTVSRALSHARVHYTRLDSDTEDEAKEVTAVLNKASGFLRNELSRDASMRMVPRLSFYFDSSVGQGRHLEGLIRRAAQADRDLGLRQDEDPDSEET